MSVVRNTARLRFATNEHNIIICRGDAGSRTLPWSVGRIKTNMNENVKSAPLDTFIPKSMRYSRMAWKNGKFYLTMLFLTWNFVGVGESNPLVHVWQIIDQLPPRTRLCSRTGGKNKLIKHTKQNPCFVLFLVLCKVKSRSRWEREGRCPEPPSSS